VLSLAPAGITLRTPVKVTAGVRTDLLSAKNTPTCRSRTTPALPRKPWPLSRRIATRACAGAKQNARRWYGDLPAAVRGVYEAVMLPAGHPAIDCSSGCPAGYPEQESNLRSRLRRPPSQSFGLLPWTWAAWTTASRCSDDHSAYLPGHAELSSCKRWTYPRIKAAGSSRVEPVGISPGSRL